MKYFIQYPCYLVCNLRCKYCFHLHDFKQGVEGGPNFTIEEYQTWKDTHLKDREEVVIHFHGGEPTMEKNINLIESFFDKSKEERLDVLTNGTGPIESYERLIGLRDQIFRIGFTYHRQILDDNPVLKKAFVDRVLRIKKAGVPLYVKEMLFLDKKPEILSHQKFWKSMSVPFKIQDFKGYDRGQDFTELQKYTIQDLQLIDNEYVKTSNTCTCLPGYRQIMIRGGWQAGDVLGCWVDPTVVGNIKENTYNPAYKVDIDRVYGGRMTVSGVPKIYKGTYEKDRYRGELKKNAA